jgi:hypothetical protein
MVSIPVNIAIIFYTSDSLSELLDRDDDSLTDAYYMLGFAAGLEHVIILFKMLIQAIILDVPRWVKVSRKD